MKNILLFLFCILAFQHAFGQEREVTFKTDTLTLYGTLAVPNGIGPFPAIVLVHGSGPNSRDETVTLADANAACLFPGLFGKTIKTFADLSDAFVAEGYIVLRYDKRTFTHGTSLPPKDIVINDFILDVNSAIDFLKMQPEVDNSRLILMGHSQGGNMINIVAAQRNDVAALVGLAAPSLSIDTIIAGQIRYIYTQCGDSNTGKAQAAQLLDAFGQVRKGTWNPNTPIMGAYPKFWLDWMHKSDSSVEYYLSAGVPALFIQGAADFNVTPENAHRFGQQLGAKADVHVLPHINHFLTDSTTPKVASVVSDTILYWLRNTVLAVGERQMFSPEVRYDSAKRTITVVSRDGQKMEQLRLETLAGKSQKAVFRNVDNGYLLHLHSLKNGIYILRGEINGETFATKIMVR